jgi:hypothetical protein
MTSCGTAIPGAVLGKQADPNQGGHFIPPVNNKLRWQFEPSIAALAGIVTLLKVVVMQLMLLPKSLGGNPRPTSQTLTAPSVVLPIRANMCEFDLACGASVIL